MPTTVVVASHKGGTGKTTTTITLGHALARAGKRVLLIDFDPQGNAAEFLGVDPANGVYRLLSKREPLDACVVPTGREGLDLLPGDATTVKAQQDLAGAAGFDQRLRRALVGVSYDWVLVDTAPSLGLLQVLAFAAGDWLLVPTELEYASGRGVAKVLHTVNLLRNDIDLTIELAGILPTMWDQRYRESDSQLQLLAQRFPGKCWLPIPTDARAREAPGYGATLWEYAPESPAIKGRVLGAQKQLVGGYEQAAQRLLKTCTKGGRHGELRF